MRGHCGADSTDSFGNFYISSFQMSSVDPNHSCSLGIKIQRSTFTLTNILYEFFLYFFPWLPFVAYAECSLILLIAIRILPNNSLASSAIPAAVYSLFSLSSQEQGLTHSWAASKKLFCLCFVEVTCFTVFLLCQRECTQNQVHPHIPA